MNKSRMSGHGIERRTPGFVGSLGVALVVIAMSQPSALADEVERNKRDAQVVFDEGLRLFDQGRYGEACPRFEAALNLYSTGIGIRGKLAECYEKIGKIASAYDHYRVVIERANERGEPDRALYATERVSILESRLPRVIIDPGLSSSLDGFTLKIDARRLHASNYRTEVIVDPGRRVISATADGYRIFEKEITIDEREIRAVGVPALEPLTAGDTGGRRVSTLSLVLFGAGLASLGSSGWLYLRAVDEREAFIDQTGCEMPPSGSWVCATEFEDEFEAVKARVRLYRITLGIGIASIAAGTLLLMRGTPAQTRGSRQSLQIIPTVTPSSIGVVLSHPL